MTSKIALLAYICGFAVQTISSQCIGAYNTANVLGWDAPAAGPWGAPLAYSGAPYAAPFPAPYAAEGLVPFAPSNGGGFTITSTSPIAPTGVRVTSENAYEGPLAVSGHLPFLGAVALEGTLPTFGAGAINYGCGSGNVGMVNEDFGYGPFGYRDIAGPAYGYDAAITGPGFGYNGYGCGCGAYY